METSFQWMNLNCLISAIHYSRLWKYLYLIQYHFDCYTYSISFELRIAPSAAVWKQNLWLKNVTHDMWRIYFKRVCTILQKDWLPSKRRLSSGKLILIDIYFHHYFLFSIIFCNWSFFHWKIFVFVCILPVVNVL